MIGSIYFVGWVVSSIFLPRMCDIYGRKKLFFVSMAGQNIAYLGVILSRNLDLTIAFMFFLGFFSVGRATIGYLYMQEMTPIKYQVIVGSVALFFSGFVTVFIMLYFMYVSKYWVPF